MASDRETNLPSDFDASLRELAELIRSADHLEGEAKEELAELFDDLAQALADGRIDAAEAEQIEQVVQHVEQAIRESHPGILAMARDAAERLVASLDARAPMLTGFLRRLADLLSDLGI